MFSSRMRILLKEQGLSLLEAGMVLVLAAVVIAGIITYMTQSQNTLKLRTDAQQLNTIAHAAETYLIASQAAIASDSRYDNATAISVSDLIDDGFIASGVADTNSHGQTLTVYVKRFPNPPPSTSYTPEAMVVSWGGTPFSDTETGQIVNFAGAEAGFISPLDPNHIDGAGGGWQFTPAQWDGIVTHGGYPVAFVGGGDTTTTNTGPWLAREDLGAADPKHLLNTMQTNLLMNQNNIQNASMVTTNELDPASSGTTLSIGTDQVGDTILIGSGSIDQANQDIGLNANHSINLNAENGNGTTSTPATVSLYTLAKQAHNSHSPIIDTANVSLATTFDNNTEIDLETVGSRNTKINLSNYRDGLGSESILLSSSLTPFNSPLPQPGIAINDGGYFEVDHTYPNDGSTRVLPFMRIMPSCIDGYTGKHKHGGTNTQMLLLGTPDNYSGNNFNHSFADLDINGYLAVQYGYYADSDRRLKTDIRPLSDVFDRLDQLHGYRFKWKSTGTTTMGVIAQEVEKVYPELVTTSTAGHHYKAVNYNGLIAPLIEAVKTLHRLELHLAKQIKQLFQRQDQQELTIQRLQAELKVQQTEIHQLQAAQHGKKTS